MAKIEKIEVFVPALALEQRGNPEYATLREKLIRAVIRWWQKEDFFVDIDVNSETPFVYLEDIKFDKDSFGYHVYGELKWG